VNGVSRPAVLGRVFSATNRSGDRGSGSWMHEGAAEYTERDIWAIDKPTIYPPSSTSGISSAFVPVPPFIAKGVHSRTLSPRIFESQGPHLDDWDTFVRGAQASLQFRGVATQTLSGNRESARW